MRLRNPVNPLPQEAFSIYINDDHFHISMDLSYSSMEAKQK